MIKNLNRVKNTTKGNKGSVQFKNAKIFKVHKALYLTTSQNTFHVEFRFNFPNGPIHTSPVKMDIKISDIKLIFLRNSETHYSWEV